MEVGALNLARCEIEQYERDGFLVIERLLDPGDVDRLLSRVAELVEDPARQPGIRLQVEPSLTGETAAPRLDTLRKIEGLVEHDEIFGDLARNPRVLGVFQSLLGPDVKLFRDALMMKPARHGSAKPYHQDSAYWSIDPPELASAWIALDEATLENGCMRVLPGSHRWGLQRHEHLADFQVDEAALDTSGEIAAPLPAGGALFFHSMLLHATSPNLSPRPRRAMILSCMSARFRWTGDPSRKPAFPLLAGAEYPDCV